MLFPLPLRISWSWGLAMCVDSICMILIDNCLRSRLWCGIECLRYFVFMFSLFIFHTILYRRFHDLPDRPIVALSGWTSNQKSEVLLITDTVVD